jgi:hypothetical protein
VPAPPAHAPKRDNIPMFCNVCLPAIYQALVSEQACITSTGPSTPASPARDPQRMYTIMFDVPDEFGSVLYREGWAPFWWGAV